MLVVFLLLSLSFLTSHWPEIVLKPMLSVLFFSTVEYGTMARLSLRYLSTVSYLYSIIKFLLLRGYPKVENLQQHKDQFLQLKVSLHRLKVAP